MAQGSVPFVGSWKKLPREGGRERETYGWIRASRVAWVNDDLQAFHWSYVAFVELDKVTSLGYFSGVNNQHDCNGQSCWSHSLLYHVWAYIPDFFVALGTEAHLGCVSGLWVGLAWLGGSSLWTECISCLCTTQPPPLQWHSKHWWNIPNIREFHTTFSSS